MCMRLCVPSFTVCRSILKKMKMIVLRNSLCLPDPCYWWGGGGKCSNNADADDDNDDVQSFGVV